MTDYVTDNGLNMAAVREQLNQLRFTEGERRLPIGHVTDLFANRSPEEVAAGIERVRTELANHDLTLEQSAGASDQLLIVQQLKHRPSDVNAMARAMQWVSRITTIALEMVVPAVAGTWLDHQFETNFLVVVGLVIGVPLGLWHLVQMTKP